MSDEQTLQVLDLPRQLARMGSREPLRRLATTIGGILDVKSALVVNVEGRWVVLAESGDEPRLPAEGAAAWAAFGRLVAMLGHDVQVWHQGSGDWTLTALAADGTNPVVLLLHGDWTLSVKTLLLLSQSLRVAEYLPASHLQGRISLAAHRLTRRLNGIVGLKPVGAVVLRHVVRAIPCRLATLAVPTEHGNLAIVATHGYPLELVDWIRMPPGSGALGTVFQNGVPLCVPDVRLFPGLRRRKGRYRTNSFLAMPVTAGSTVVGVICLTDRLDHRAFTQDDVESLSGLVPAVALALARERASQRADHFARAAILDPLSGLYNRRHFYERLEEELDRARRHRFPVGLLMIDIDGFKGVNDRFGHMAGDAVIKAVAEILRSSVRKFDLCTRLGGDEFAVVMPASTVESAEQVAERIRGRVEGFRSGEAALTELRATASIGLATVEGATPRELIGRADQALYAAKRAGKNRISRWTPTSNAVP